MDPTLSPFEIAGIRSDLAQSLSLDEVKGLSGAALRILAHRHHPDRGGDAGLMARVNMAVMDLGEGDFLSALREEYLAANPFAQKLSRCREHVSQTENELWAEGFYLAGLVAAGSMQHVMQWEPCHIILVKPESIAQKMMDCHAAEVEHDKRYAERAGRLGRVVVTEEEIARALMDGDTVSRLILENGELYSLQRDYIEEQMGKVDPDAVRFYRESTEGRAMRDWTADQIEAQPLWKRYQKLWHKFEPSSLQHPEVRVQLERSMRAELRSQRKADASGADALRQFDDEGFGRLRDLKDNARLELLQSSWTLSIGPRGEVIERDPMGMVQQRPEINLIGALATSAFLPTDPSPWTHSERMPENSVHDGQGRSSGLKRDVIAQSISRISAELIARAILGEEIRNTFLFEVERIAEQIAKDDYSNVDGDRQCFLVGQMRGPNGSAWLENLGWICGIERAVTPPGAEV